MSRIQLLTAWLIVAAIGSLGCGGKVIIERRAGGGEGGAGAAQPAPLVACNSIEAEQLRTLDTVAVDAFLSGKLAPTRADGGQLSLFYIDDAGPFSQVTFSPWSAWSSAPLTAPVELFVGLERFAVTRYPEDGYGLALESSYLHHADAAEDHPLFNPVSKDGAPAFITGMDDRGDRLRGLSDFDGVLMLQLGDELTTDLTEAIACGGIMDAVAVGDGFLLALALAGGELWTCSSYTDPIDTILLARVRRDAAPEVIEVIEASGEVQSLRLLPRTHGHWLLWSASDSHAVELGGDMRPVRDVLGGGGGEIAAPRGDGFVVSSRVGGGQGVLRVYDADAELTAEVEYEASGYLHAAPSVAVSPDGASIVSAWVQVPAAQTAVGALVARRFSCAD